MHASRGEGYTSEAHRAAADYRDRGWAPIPTKPRSKEPNLRELRAYLTRKATQEELAAWSWSGVGIVTGPLSGVLVLDVDGAKGEAELQKHGHPVTPMVRTASGGLHLYFRHPEHHVRTGIRVAPGLDVKAAGGYVVAPPSVGPNGSPYEWIVSPEDADLAEPPGWLIELLERERPKGPAGPVGERIPEGRRNKDLASIGGTMRRRGMGEAEILAALRVANEQRCEPPLEAAEVEKIAASAARYAAQISVNGHGTAQPPRAYNLTDLGNAERFVARHGADVRYCYPWSTWLVWTGARWAVDNSGGVHRRAKRTVKGIYREAGDATGDEARKALAKHAMRSEAENRIQAMISLAKSEVPVMPEELDRDPWLLNALNGTLDLRTGELRDHRRDDLITKSVGCVYDPDADAPTWAAVLERTIPSEPVREFFKKLCGRAFSGDVSEHVLPVLYGTGANGKSTVLNALLEAAGEYGMQAAPDLLIAKRGNHPTEVADLFGMRFVASIEVEDGRRLAESLVKTLTGGDRVRARRMRQDFWEFAPTHKVFMAVNHKPQVKGNDTAIWRRIRLIRFTETIPPAEQDKGLPEKLRAELPGVLAWAVEGCLEWQREGLKAPEEVRRDTGEYRSEMDVIGAFLKDCCEKGGGHSVAAKDLYTRYKTWCEENGEAPEKQRTFGSKLSERGYERYRGGASGGHRWRGLTLCESAVCRGSDPTDLKVSIAASKSARVEGNGTSGSDGSVGSVTEEQNRRIRQLVSEGMKEEIAREAVLKKGQAAP